MARRCASRLVKLKRSCWVRGPVGFCKASRMAEFKPGSGIAISCAPREAEIQVRISARANRSKTLIGPVWAVFIFDLRRAGQCTAIREPRKGFVPGQIKGSNALPDRESALAANEQDVEVAGATAASSLTGRFSTTGRRSGLLGALDTNQYDAVVL